MSDDKKENTNSCMFICGSNKKRKKINNLSYETSSQVKINDENPMSNKIVIPSSIVYSNNTSINPNQRKPSIPVFKTEEKKENLSTIPKGMNQSAIYVNTEALQGENIIYEPSPKQSSKTAKNKDNKDTKANLYNCSTNDKPDKLDQLNIQEKLMNTDSFLSYSKKNESFDNKNNIRVEFSRISNDHITANLNQNIFIDKGPVSSISSIEPSGANKYTFSPGTVQRHEMNNLEEDIVSENKSSKFQQNFIAPIKIIDKRDYNVDVVNPEQFKSETGHIKNKESINVDSNFAKTTRNPSNNNIRLENGEYVFEKKPSKMSFGNANVMINTKSPSPNISKKTSQNNVQSSQIETKRSNNNINIINTNNISNKILITTSDDCDVPIEDEFKEIPSQRSVNVSECNKSIISSNVFSRQPKTMGDILNDQSFLNSSFRSENTLSRIDSLSNNVIFTQSSLNEHIAKNPFQLTNSKLEDSELEFNRLNTENFKFKKLFDSNKSEVNLYNTTQNSYIMEFYEKLNHKEKSLKTLHDNNQKMSKYLAKLEEENKNYERRIEKEDADSEKLRHILNFLISNQGNVK